MFGYVPYGEIPYGAVRDVDDRSSPDPIQKLLDGNLLSIRYLVEIYAYDLVAEQEEILRLSDHQFITEPDDDAPNEYYHPVVDSALSYDVSLIRGNEIGVNRPTFGAVEIKNGDAVLDGVAGLSFSGRRVVVKAGYDGFRYVDYATVFDGIATNIVYDDRTIIIPLSDKGSLLDREIITPEYDGSGGLNGTVDIAGRMMPLAYGKCFNIEPVLVDPVNLIYQCHAWSMEAVDAVYDAGVALTFDEDVADITTASPASGQYATSLATGHIKLGSTPAGRITADVQGDNDGGYAGTVGEICVRMALTLYDTLSFHPDDIDDAWSDLGLPEAGIYIVDRRTMRQLFDQLLNPCLAYWYFTRFGRLSADLIDTAAGITGNINADLIDTAGIEMVMAVPPSWKITVAYAPVWTVQNESELAGATVEAHRTFVGNEYRLVTHEDTGVRAAYAKPLERTFYSNLASKSDAEALLARLVSLYGTERRVFRGAGYQAAYRIALSDRVSLNYPRYGASGNYTVVGISNDAKTGKTTMELWG